MVARRIHDGNRSIAPSRNANRLELTAVEWVERVVDERLLNLR